MAERDINQLRRRRRNGEDNAGSEEEGDEGDDDDEDKLHMSKKELLRIEKKRAKAEAKAQMDAMRDTRREKESKREDLYRERALEREQEFLRKEEEAARLKAEKEQKERDEYNPWKEVFTFESIGMTSDMVTVTQQKILDFIKENKVVLIDSRINYFNVLYTYRL